MRDPKLSVVMPVYNGEAYVAETIQSVLEQSFRDFEFVIVDDGSTDSTANILDRFAALDQRIRVLHQKNLGLVPALNSGCAAARGKYIGRIDHDDVARRERFEKQVTFLESHQDIALVGSGFVHVDNRGRSIRAEAFPCDDRALRRALERYNPFCSSTVMLRTSALRAAGGYRVLLTYAEDYDLWCRIAERGRLANLAEPLVYRRIHSNQASVVNLKQQTLAVLAIRRAAEVRGAGGIDLLRNLRLLNFEVLREWGVDSDEISTTLSAAYLWWAETFLTAGQEETALILITEALRDPDAKSMDTSSLAKIYWSAALRNVKNRNPPRSLYLAWRANSVWFQSFLARKWLPARSAKSLKIKS